MDDYSIQISRHILGDFHWIHFFSHLMSQSGFIPLWVVDSYLSYHSHRRLKILTKKQESRVIAGPPMGWKSGSPPALELHWNPSHSSLCPLLFWPLNTDWFSVSVDKQSYDRTRFSAHIFLFRQCTDCNWHLSVPSPLSQERESDQQYTLGLVCSQQADRTEGKGNIPVGREISDKEDHKPLVLEIILYN